MGHKFIALHWAVEVRGIPVVPDVARFKLRV